MARKVTIHDTTNARSDEEISRDLKLTSGEIFLLRQVLRDVAQNRIFEPIGAEIHCLTNIYFKLCGTGELYNGMDRKEYIEHYCFSVIPDSLDLEQEFVKDLDRLGVFYETDVNIDHTIYYFHYETAVNDVLRVLHEDAINCKIIWN